MNKTSKFKRAYGFSVAELCKKYGRSATYIRGLRKKGLLKALPGIDVESEYKALPRHLVQILKNVDHRCNNPTDKKYQNYGGRGIRNFLSIKDIEFLWKRDGAKKMKQPSIDRIDSNGNYEIKNCRFIEMSENRKRR